MPCSFFLKSGLLGVWKLHAGMGTRGCEDAPVRRRSASPTRPSVSLYRERAAVVVEGVYVCRSRFLSTVIRGFLWRAHVYSASNRMSFLFTILAHL